MVLLLLSSVIDYVLVAARALVVAFVEGFRSLPFGGRAIIVAMHRTLSAHSLLAIVGSASAAQHAECGGQPISDLLRLRMIEARRSILLANITETVVQSLLSVLHVTILAIIVPASTPATGLLIRTEHSLDHAIDVRRHTKHILPHSVDSLLHLSDLVFESARHLTLLVPQLLVAVRLDVDAVHSCVQLLHTIAHLELVSQMLRFIVVRAIVMLATQVFVLLRAANLSAQSLAEQLGLRGDVCLIGAILLFHVLAHAGVQGHQLFDLLLLAVDRGLHGHS